jgi:hypothetical protein
MEVPMRITRKSMFAAAACLALAAPILLAEPTFAKTLVCPIPVENVTQPVVRITHFDSALLASANLDADLFDYQMDGSKVSISFSNECDNMWTFTFERFPLYEAVRGKRSDVSGQVKVAEAGQGVDATAQILCSVISTR